MTIQSPAVGDHVYAVILAGGSGTRFWPKSRLKQPKQLCRIGGDVLTMIERTLARLDGFVPVQRRIIVTHKDQVELTRKICANRCRYFIAEPEARNTAAALALAALDIERLAASTTKPIMISLHADHLIDDEDQFRSDLGHAVQLAQHGYLSLIGIPPTRPATEFGYIEQGERVAGPVTAYRVAQFREKPKSEIAQQYLAKGGFYWNSGYFIWKTSVLLDEFREYLPDTLTRLSALAEQLGKGFYEASAEELAPVYKTLAKVAIDNAILELSQKVAFIPAKFGWNDVGSWDALDECLDQDTNGNIVQGDALLIDSFRCITESNGMFIATLGVSDLVIVQSGNAILVADKKKAQDVKKIVEELQKLGRSDLTD